MPSEIKACSRDNSIRRESYKDQDDGAAEYNDNFDNKLSAI